LHIYHDKPFRENRVSSSRSKAINGIEYEHFLALVDLAEQKHLENKQKLKNKVRLIAIGGGRRPDMSSKQGICLCLVYLRQKPIFEILGLLFDVSKTKANDAFNYWIEILRDILPASQMEEVGTDEAKYQRQSLLGYELIVDSAEQPVQRPVDYQGRKKILLRQKRCIHLKINLLFYLMARISLM